jgi:hypothetical protein
VNAAELATLIVAVTPGVVALAKAYRQTDQVRKLEEQRPRTGDRFGALEKEVDRLAGRMEELSRALWARPHRPLGAPVDRGDLLPRKDDDR